MYYTRESNLCSFFMKIFSTLLGLGKCFPLPNTTLSREEVATRCAQLLAAANEGAGDEVVEILEADPELLRVGDPVGDTALHVLARDGHMDALKQLIRLLQSKPDWWELLSTVAQQGNGDGDTALHLAVKNKHMEAVILLYEAEYMAKYVPNDDGKVFRDLANELEDNFRDKLSILTYEENACESAMPESTVPLSAMLESTVPLISATSAMLESPMSESVMLESTMPLSAMPESTMPLSPMSESAMLESAMPDSAMPESTMPLSAMPESPMPESTMPLSPMSESAMLESAMPDSAMPELTMLLSAMPESIVPLSTMLESTVPLISATSPMPESAMLGSTMQESAMPDSPMPESTVPLISATSDMEMDLVWTTLKNKAVEMSPIPESAMLESTVTSDMGLHLVWTTLKYKTVEMPNLTVQSSADLFVPVPAPVRLAAMPDMEMDLVWTTLKNNAVEMLRSDPELLETRSKLNGNTLFHDAAHSGNMEMLTNLFQLKPSTRIIVERNNWGETALSLAMRSRHTKVASYLIKMAPKAAKAAYQVNQQGESPLYMAIKQGDYDLVKEMLQLMPISGVSSAAKDALLNVKKHSLPHAAIRSRNLRMLQDLLESLPILIDSFDEKEWKPLSYAAYKGYLDEVRYLLKSFPKSVKKFDSDGSLPIHKAVSGGHISIFKEFISCHPQTLYNIDKKGRTILHIAVRYAKYDILTYVTRKINDVHKILDVRDYDGKTFADLAKNLKHN